MWCSEVREALPLLEGLDTTEHVAVKAHVAECPACAELLRAYEGDARALSQVRAQRSAPPAMAGFADGVFARLAQPGPAAELPALEAADTARVARPEGLVIRIGWQPVAALAAALLLALGLVIGARPELPVGVPTVAETPTLHAPVPVAPVAHRGSSDPAPLASQLPSRELATPLPVVPVDTAPMPRRAVRRSREGDVMPVDRTRGRSLPDVKLPRDMERMLKEMQRWLPPPPAPPARKDEVRF